MNFRIRTIFAGLALSALAVGAASGQQQSEEGPAYGPELEGFDYPFPVERFSFTSERQSLQMAYLDVKPDHPNGRTVVLLHGKNFCSATWEPTIKDLVAAGYRVVAPDQIGFCKSSKPVVYQFTFRELAGNTHALLGQTRRGEAGRGRPFDWRHAGGALHAALSEGRQPVGPGQSRRA